MSEKSIVALRLLFAFVVLSGATIYGVATTAERSELRKLDHLGRQILRSIQEGTPLYERALREADRSPLADVHEELSGRIVLAHKEKTAEDWRVGYCFKSGLYAEFRFATPREQPRLTLDTAAERCLQRDDL